MKADRVIPHLFGDGFHCFDGRVIGLELFLELDDRIFREAVAAGQPRTDATRSHCRQLIHFRHGSSCFRCGEKGHWSRDCPQSAKNQMQAKGNDEGILGRNRADLRGRDARMYDKRMLEQRERNHYGGGGHYGGR